LFDFVFRKNIFLNYKKNDQFYFVSFFINTIEHIFIFVFFNYLTRKKSLLYVYTLKILLQQWLSKIMS